MSLILDLYLLARLRREQAELLAAAEAAEATAMATPEYAAFKVAQAKLRTKSEEVRESEVALRDLALITYEETDDKRPAPGITIKEFCRLRYDPAMALEWCKTYAKAFVKEILDAKSFEKVAGNLIGAPVTVEREARAYIDADLSGHLVDTPTTQEEAGPAPQV
jgi:hypothetical protein